MSLRNAAMLVSVGRFTSDSGNASYLRVTGLRLLMGNHTGSKMFCYSPQRGN